MTRTRAAGTAQAQAWILDLARQQRLSPTQRRVVQCMVDTLPDVAFLSTVEIAERAGVSQPTVTRLASVLGFSAYSDFRAAVREVVLAGAPVVEDTARPDPRVTAVEEERSNLDSLRETVRSEQMDAAVRILTASSPLGVLGLRASAALADYFGYFARRVLPNVQTLTDAAVIDDAVLELHEQGGSALLVFAMPRYPAHTVTAVRLARGLGMSTVVIADTPLLPFAADADVLLVAPVGAGLVFDSHAAAVVLAISLLDALAGTDPRRTQGRLEAHEGLVERWVYNSR